MNITRLRALPRSRVAILIDENLNEVKIFQTAPVPVKHKFDWTEINNREITIKKLKLKKGFEVEYETLGFDEIQKEEKNELVL